MRQVFYLIVAVAFIIGQASAHVTEHSPAEKEGISVRRAS